MVTVSSAFMSSRRERIIFRVLSASGCAFKAAAFVDVLRAGLTAVFSETLGKTDLDNTDVGRDHSFRCIASVESLGARHYITHVGLMVSIFQCPFLPFEIHSSHSHLEVRKKQQRRPTIAGMLCARAGTALLQPPASIPVPQAGR